MSENIIVPSLGESITEATIAKWIKNKGERVKLDEPIVELETDKVNVEVPSPAEGVISKVNFNNGDTVEVGALLGTISFQDEKNISSEEKVIPIGKSKKEKIEKINIQEEERLSVFDDSNLTTDSKEEDTTLVLDQKVEDESEKPLVLKKEIKEEKKRRNRTDACFE